MKRFLGITLSVFYLLIGVGLTLTALDLYHGTNSNYVLGNDIEMLGFGLIGLGILTYLRRRRKRA
jgi:hypothetical protein